MATELSFANRDVRAIKEDIINYIKSKQIGWTDFSQSDIGTILIEVMAGVADMLNYYIDVNAKECFLETADEPKNIRAILEQYNYPYYIVQPPKVKVKITLNRDGAGSPTTAVEIPRWTEVRTTDEQKNSQVRYVTTDLVRFAPGETEKEIECIQGHVETRRLQVSTLKHSYKYFLGSADVCKEGVRIIQHDSEWERVEDVFIDTDGGQKFSVKYAPGGDAYILFSFDWTNYFPSNESEIVELRVLHSVGIEGDVGAGQVCQIEGPIWDELNHNVIQYITITNPESSYGGKDYEDWIKCKANARNYIMSMGRAVTLDDYKGLVLADENVCKAYVCDKRSDATNCPAPFEVHAWLVFNDGPMDGSNLETVMAQVQNKIDKSCDVLVSFKPHQATFAVRKVSVALKMSISNRESRNALRAVVEKALKEWGSFKNWNMGDSVDRRDLVGGILRMDERIEKVAVVGFDEPIIGDILTIPYIQFENVEVATSFEETTMATTERVTTERVVVIDRTLLSTEEEISKDPSQNEVREAVKKIWTRAGGTITSACFALATLFSTACASAATPPAGACYDKDIFKETPIVTNAWQNMKSQVQPDSEWAGKLFNSDSFADAVRDVTGTSITIKQVQEQVEFGPTNQGAVAYATAVGKQIRDQAWVEGTNYVEGVRKEIVDNQLTTNDLEEAVQSSLVNQGAVNEIRKDLTDYMRKDDAVQYFQFDILGKGDFVELPIELIKYPSASYTMRVDVQPVDPTKTISEVLDADDDYEKLLSLESELEQSPGALDVRRDLDCFEFTFIGSEKKSLEYDVSGQERCLSFIVSCDKDTVYSNFAWARCFDNLSVLNSEYHWVQYTSSWGYKEMYLSKGLRARVTVWGPLESQLRCQSLVEASCTDYLKSAGGSAPYIDLSGYVVRTNDNVIIGKDARGNDSNVVVVGKGSYATAGQHAVVVGAYSSAQAENGVSVGFNAIVGNDAKGSVQLGSGTLQASNSLQFADIMLVSNGVQRLQSADKVLVGSQTLEQVVSNEVLKAKTQDHGSFDAIVRGGEIRSKIYAVSNVTFDPDDVDEAIIYQDALGMSQIFIENNATNRLALPILFGSSDGNLLGPTGPFNKLPLLVTLVQPYDGRGLLEVKEFEDGYKWDPQLTGHDMIVTATEDSFKIVTGDRYAEFSGTNLQFLTDSVAMWAVYDSETNSIPVTFLSTQYGRLRIGNFSYSTNEVPSEVIFKATGSGFERIFKVY